MAQFRLFVKVQSLIYFVQSPTLYIGIFIITTSILYFLPQPRGLVYQLFSEETSIASVTPTLTPTKEPTQKPDEPTWTPTKTPRPQPTWTPTKTPRPQPTWTPTKTPRPQPTWTPTKTPRPSTSIKKPTSTLTSTPIPTKSSFTLICPKVNNGHAFDGGLLIGCEGYIYYAFYNDHHIEKVVMSEAEAKANQKTYCGEASNNPNLEWGLNLAFCKAREQYGQSLGNAGPYADNLNITFGNGVVNFNGEFGLQKFIITGDRWEFGQ